MKTFTLIAMLVFLAVYGQAQISVYINEVDYNIDTATPHNEGFEIAGPANTDLSGWKVSIYTQQVDFSTSPPVITYPVQSTVNLSGTIGDDANGFGVLWFDADLPSGTVSPFGLQHPTIGLALEDNSGQLIQFISIAEAIGNTPVPFTATGGIADGIESEPHLPETDMTIHSSQLTGTGTVYGDFTWSHNTAPSHGQPNTGQTLSVPDTPALEVSVYPNPAQQYVQISGVSGLKNIAVYDLFGRLRLEKTIENWLEVSALPKGVYLINIEQNSKTALRKLIIQ